MERHSIESQHRMQTQGRVIAHPFALTSLLWKSAIALWLRICLFCFIFWHLMMLSRLCGNYKLSVHRAKAFEVGRCGLNTQGPSERKKDRNAVNTLSLALKMCVCVGER